MAGDPAESPRQQRERLRAAVEALAPQVGVPPACAAVGVNRAAVYRRRERPTPPPGVAIRPRPPLALTEAERQAVLDLLHSERFIDQAPPTVYATLLDEGR